MLSALIATIQQKPPQFIMSGMPKKAHMENGGELLTVLTDMQLHSVLAKTKIQHDKHTQLTTGLSDTMRLVSIRKKRRVVDDGETAVAIALSDRMGLKSIRKTTTVVEPMQPSLTAGLGNTMRLTVLTRRGFNNGETHAAVNVGLTDIRLTQIQ